MSLRPSPSPSPGPNENGKAAARQSMGPSSRVTSGLAPASPRPGAGAGSGARPTSELLGGGSAGRFQSTPEAEALDQWFENLQNYEQTLEDMAAASLDVNFKEELSAIEQWFKVLSEAERTAALYSLLQHSTQVQIRFFITVLQQMARSDPMTALLSPAMGGSMQSQMEARLASLSLNSPALTSGLPASPTARNFTPGNRSSLVLDSTSNFLSPDSAALPTGIDPAATLAKQRAQLKASNAAHRISAPVLSTGTLDGRPTWSSPSSQLDQVSEQNIQEITINASRPKSTEFSGNLSPRPVSSGDASASSGGGGGWADMVNTPHIQMFPKETRTPPQGLDGAMNKLNEWKVTPPPGVPRMGDPTVHRRTGKNGQGGNENSNAVYDDNGNLVSNHGQQQNAQGRRNNNNGFNGQGAGGWSGARSPALSNTSSNRFNGNDDNGSNPGGMNNGMGMGGFNMGMGSPTMGMPGMGLGGMGPMSPLHMNMLAQMGMGLTPEAQILAAQMAAQGFGQPNWAGMQPPSAGLGSRRGPASGRSPGLKSASSVGSRNDGGTPKAEEDVDPTLLTDIPAWLRSLRLHKYTPNFEGCKWEDMVLMDEAALEAKGVAALGARRKMLKTFELVRKKMNIEGGPPLSATSSVKSP